MAVQERVFIFQPGQELKPAQNIVDQMKTKISRRTKLSSEDQKQLQIALSMMISEVRRAGDLGAIDRRNRALNAFKQSQEFFTSTANQNYLDRSTQHFILAQRNIVDRIQNEKPRSLAANSNTRSNSNPSSSPRISSPPKSNSLSLRPTSGKSLTPTSSAPSISQTSIAVKPTGGSKKTDKEADTSKADPSRWTFSGCILGGFALTSDSCKVPKELPKDFLENQNTLKAKDFVCQNELALCNPLIFGYDCANTNSDGLCPDSKKPICLAPKLSLTKDCRNRSSSSNHLKRALELIKKEPKLFDQFSKNFDLICNEDQLDKNRFVYFKIDGSLRTNSDHIKKDLIQTCRAAKVRLTELKQSLTSKPTSSVAPKSKEQGRQ